MAKRPHINKLSKELIDAVNGARGAAEQLRELIYEIEFRKKARAKLTPTLEKAKKMLEAAELETEPKPKKKSRYFRTEENSASQIKTKITIPPKPIEKLDLEEHQDSSSKINTDIETSNKARPWSIPFEMKPWFLPRLFGKDSTYIWLKGDALQIEHRNSESRVKLGTIESATITVGLFYATLTLCCSSETISISGLSRGSVKHLESFLVSCRFGEELQRSLIEFAEMLRRDNYLNHRFVVDWADSHHKAFMAVKDLKQANADSENLASKWFKLANEWQIMVGQRNKLYVTKKAKEWRDYFDKLESNPLSARQVEAILRDEDHALIVAGAGTGKTSVVIGKIAFLIDSKEVQSDEILALAYGKKAAEEMRGRIAERTGHDVDISTFHALGFKITANVESEKPVISDAAKYDHVMHALLARLVSEMTSDEKTRDAVLNFVSFHRYPAKYLEDFDDNGDYLKYLRKLEPRTLRGEQVKSFEELLIADWLTLHDVEYEYEYPYEHKTASRKKRQYKPDFYIKDYGIYLEHFGVGRKGKTAPGIDERKYAEGMAWKRDLHAENRTKLIETYSWERQEGILLDELHRKLTEAGVHVDPSGGKQVEKLMSQREINQKVISLLRDFLNVFKEGQWTFEEIDENILNLEGSDRERALSFLNLFKPLFERYETHLHGRREIDFSDLIRKATEYLDSGLAKVFFRRIIVDEYQDISRGRYRLLKKLLGQAEDTRMMCVGDDWQSIYGFTGSDIRMTTSFESLFGFTSRVDLDQTFRFTQPILDSSARFVQTNPIQIKKSIKARKPRLEKSIEIIGSEIDGSIDLKKLFKKINQDRPKKDCWTVMLLGRYNFTEPKSWKEDAKQFKFLKVQYLTIHKSKGLGADVVVVLDLKVGRYGFPGEIPNDPLMKMVLPAEEEFPRAEERRVLYVAMTRAKEKVFLVSDKSNPSEFIDELKLYPEVYVAGDQIIGNGNYTCDECKRGRLVLAFPKRVNGYAWQCSLNPYCSGKSKFCSKCMQAPLSCVNHACMVV